MMHVDPADTPTSESATMMRPVRPLATLAAAAVAAALFSACAQEAPMTPELAAKWDEATLWSIDATTLDGRATTLAEHEGKVVLVVNVASKCGFTKQYEGLEALYREHKDEGFVVLGFPSADFGGQEFDSEAEIAAFCEENYGVSFPMYAKTGVNPGPDQSPVFEYLGTSTGKLPGWNFGKYLVGRDGKPIGFWDSRTTPADLEDDVSAALASG